MERLPTNRNCKQLLVWVVSCVCIWLQWPFRTIFLPMSFRFGIYRRSSLEGQGPLNAHIWGAAPPPPPPPLPPLLRRPCFRCMHHGTNQYAVGLDFMASFGCSAYGQSFAGLQQCYMVSCMLIIWLCVLDDLFMDWTS